MDGVVEGVADFAVTAVELVLFAEGDMAGLVPFGLKCAYILEQVVTAFVSKGLKTCHNVEFLLQVGLLFGALLLVGSILGVEEGVASGVETLPDAFADLLRNGTDGLPFGLQCHELVGGGSPVGAVLKLLGALTEGGLEFQVLGLRFADATEMAGLGIEETVASAAETLENLLVHFSGSISYALPLCLQGDDVLRGLFPFWHRGR